MKRICAALLTVTCLTSCGHVDGQNQYSETDVGISSLVEFATVLNAREVGITGKNTGVGATAGGLAGVAAGANVGQGNGQVAAVLGGMIAGAAIGAMAEQAAADRNGIEYTLIKENGQTVTIVQNLNQGDRILQNGERAIIQTSGSYQRVLPATNLPEQIKRPKGIKVVD